MEYSVDITTNSSKNLHIVGATRVQSMNQKHNVDFACGQHILVEDTPMGVILSQDGCARVELSMDDFELTGVAETSGIVVSRKDSSGDLEAYKVFTIEKDALIVWKNGVHVSVATPQAPLFKVDEGGICTIEVLGVTIECSTDGVHVGSLRVPLQPNSSATRISLEVEDRSLLKIKVGTLVICVPAIGLEKPIRMDTERGERIRSSDMEKSRDMDRKVGTTSYVYGK